MTVPGVRSPDVPEVLELRLDDAVLCNALIEGRIRTAQIKRRNLPNAGGDVVELLPGQTLLDEALHLGKLLDCQNGTAAVVLQLPDHTTFESYGLIARLTIATGSFPVSVAALIPGQLRAPRPTGAAFTNNTVFLGASTANAAEIAVEIIRDLEGWVVDSPFGVRQAELDNTTLPVGSTLTHALEVRDSANAVVLSDVSRMDFNGAVTVTTPVAGQIEVTVTAGVPSESTLTFSGTVAWNVTTDPTTQITLTGNCTINTSGIQNGATYKITVTQDATGGRVITWGTGFVDQPEVEIGVGAVTILVFEAHAGGLYSPGNVGDPQKISGLNELLVVDGDSDVYLIERVSDGAVFKITTLGILSTVLPPLIHGTTSKVLADTDNGRMIVLTSSGTTVTATNLLTDGFVTMVVNRTGSSVAIAQSGLTLIGETTLGDNHLATIIKIATNIAICRVSG